MHCSLQGLLCDLG